MTTETPLPTIQEQLSQLFGSYKAEWLKEHIFELFTEPSYFPELLTPRSCVLIGGRGTGKTTVLRGLSYQGQHALSQYKASAIRQWQFYGLYYRVDTNHVTAFNGPELTLDQWRPLFAHYINTLLCELILTFLEWYEVNTGTSLTLAPHSCQRVATSLHLPDCQTHRELRESLLDARIAFEAYINNVVDAPRPLLSLQAAPVNLLAEAVLALGDFAGKQLFFLLDEYENFLDHQQQVVNTLIKHSGAMYSFKIGVRELGWRCHSTLNPNEQLVHPADYARVSIAEKLVGETFETFALKVCQSRIAKLDIPGETILRDLTVAFPSLSDEEEAQLLGVDSHVSRLQDELRQVCTAEEFSRLSDMSPLEKYFLSFWAQSQSQTAHAVLTESLTDLSSWQTRYGNYKHAILYTIRQGKRGIRKYYTGWGTFCQMAAGNIRYLLELVDQSLLAQFKETSSLAMPIVYDIQTKAAQRVGSMNLAELEGLAVDGARLTKLLLSLGRVFQVMAQEAYGHAPEVNQFEIVDPPEGRESESAMDADRLLTSAVMHLALLRFPGNKLGDVGETRDFDYMIHPIFSALFEFSPRRKRKMKLAPKDIIELIRHPKQSIRRILSTQNRGVDHVRQVPEQLTLFERFYNADA